METFYALLAICAGNSPILRPNKRWSKQLWGWWFETQSRPLWRHCNEMSSAKCSDHFVQTSNLLACRTTSYYKPKYRTDTRYAVSFVGYVEKSDRVVTESCCIRCDVITLWWRRILYSAFPLQHTHTYIPSSSLFGSIFATDMRSWETACWAAINSRRYREKVATFFKYMFELQHIYLISCQIVNTAYTLGTVISYLQNTGDGLIACVSAWEQSQFYHCWCEIINITCNSTTPTRMINLPKLQIIIRIRDLDPMGHIRKHESDNLVRLSYIFGRRVDDSYEIWLTHWGRDKMDAISQTTFSNAFSWIKVTSQFKWICSWTKWPKVFQYLNEILCVRFLGIQMAFNQYSFR